MSLSVSSGFPVPCPLTIRVDGHDCFGCRQCGYLSALTIVAPAVLRHVDGFPVLGLLRPLRRHGPRGPKIPAHVLAPLAALPKAANPDASDFPPEVVGLPVVVRQPVIAVMAVQNAGIP